MHSPISSQMLPTTGTPNTRNPSMMMVMAFTKESNTYGVTFPRMISLGFRGEASNSSMVPSSFSRVMVTEVIRAEISIRTRAISPGTNI